MGRTTRRAACVAIAITALVGPAIAASADQGDTVKGGCGFNATQNAILTNGQNEGLIYDASETQEATGTPSGATVQCWIDVNGIEGPATRISASGFATQSSSKQISYYAGTTDTVTLCQQVTFDDGATWLGPDGTNPDCRVVIGPPQPPLPSDLDAAYCPAGSITGTGNWAPAETTTLAPHAFVWDTQAACTGTDDEAGAYHVVFNGTANDACYGGSGSGTLSGNGPEGVITGSFTFYRGGIHLYISGTFSSGEEQHNLQYWIDVLASASGVCSYTTSSLLGHGAIWDSFPG